jgi:hypothetical protein
MILPYPKIKSINSDDDKRKQTGGIRVAVWKNNDHRCDVAIAVCGKENMRIRRFHSILRRDSSKSSSSLPLAIAVGLVTTSSIGGYYISRNSSFELPQLSHTQRTLSGLTRLGNLLTTVGVVCYDYVKIMKSQENVVRKSDPIREKIRVVRLEHEKLGLQLYQSKDQEERQKLQQEIKLIVDQLKKLSVKSPPIPPSSSLMVCRLSLQPPWKRIPHLRTLMLMKGVPSDFTNSVKRTVVFTSNWVNIWRSWITYFLWNL